MNVMSDSISNVQFRILPAFSIIISPVTIFTSVVPVFSYAENFKIGAGKAFYEYLCHCERNEETVTQETVSPVSCVIQFIVRNETIISRQQSV